MSADEQYDLEDKAQFYLTIGDIFLFINLLVTTGSILECCQILLKQRERLLKCTLLFLCSYGQDVIHNFLCVNNKSSKLFYFV